MKYPGLGASVVATCLIFAPGAAAQTNPTPDRLIDQLAQIDCNGPGLYEHFPYEDFWAVVPDLDPKAHLEGRKPDCVPDAMRALVRLGPQALPALVRHIDDRRSTGLRIGTTEEPGTSRTGGQIFAREYEGRAHVYDEESWPSPFLARCDDGDCFTERGFQAPYAIRIGDVCFILIGQIVNRYMVAARYQMTGFTIVNSPIETLSLAKRVRADWAGVDAEGLKDSLLADLRMPPHGPPPGYTPLENYPLTYEQREALSLRDLQAGALRRLRFYFPEVYASLSGDDLAKRRAFEQDEAEHKARYVEPDPEKSIDKLASINCPLPGASDTGTFGGFLAEDASMEAFSTVLFGQHGNMRYPLPCSNTAVLNIMRFGLTALPALIRHLDDKRPTELVVGRDLDREPAGLGGQFFADEYDARHQTSPLIRCAADISCEKKRPFEAPYTVKVGDICFVLIGQVVNRQLNAVRYQPTAIVLVNSPIETPALADRVRADWSGIGNEGLKNSLLADLRAAAPENASDAGTKAFVRSGALRRLRYYFPDTYASLAGADLEKRRAFENAERDRP